MDENWTYLKTLEKKHSRSLKKNFIIILGFSKRKKLLLRVWWFPILICQQSSTFYSEEWKIAKELKNVTEIESIGIEWNWKKWNIEIRIEKIEMKLKELKRNQKIEMNIHSLVRLLTIWPLKWCERYITEGVWI